MNHSVSGSEAHRCKPLPPPLPPRALMSPPVCKYANEHHTHWARAAGRGRRCPRAGGLGAEPLPRGGAAPPLPRDGPAPGLARHGTARHGRDRGAQAACSGVHRPLGSKSSGLAPSAHPHLPQRSPLPRRPVPRRPCPHSQDAAPLLAPRSSLPLATELRRASDKIFLLTHAFAPGAKC